MARRRKPPLVVKAKPRPRTAYAPYFRAVADRMNLAHWAIEVIDEDPSDAACLATVVCVLGRSYAIVRLSAGFLTIDEPEQRYVAVHELVHCLFAHPDHMAQGMMGPRDYEAWNLAREYAVDNTASVIAPWMPLPSQIL